MATTVVTLGPKGVIVIIVAVLAAVPLILVIYKYSLIIKVISTSQFLTTFFVKELFDNIIEI